MVAFPMTLSDHNPDVNNMSFFNVKYIHNKATFGPCYY